MDIYAEITNRIISEMESGIIPWAKPWVASGGCVSYATGKPYSLLNQMLLGRPGEYATFKQVQQAGGYVRKGEKAHMVVFWEWVEKEDEETGDVKEIPFLRYYNVFHIDQCEGLKTRHAEPLPQTANADQKAEAIICDYLKTSRRKSEPRTGRQSLLSSLGRFHHASSVGPIQGNRRILLHGLPRTDPQHGHAKRLNRIAGTAFFGSEAYSKEELVAEIGASALVHAAGLETPDSFRNNVGYIQNWLRVLRNDRKVIVSASGRADKQFLTY